MAENNQDRVSDEELLKMAKAVVSAFTFMSESCFYHCSHSADCRHPNIDFSCMLCAIENCPILEELS